MRRKRDYHFDLPPEQIAQAPADRRDGSRLLHVGRDDVLDGTFADLVDLVPDEAVIVTNDVRVIPARLRTRKPTGGAVELLFLELVGGGRWRCMARSSKPVPPGLELYVDGSDVVISIAAGRATDATIEVTVDGDVDALLERYGEIPLPPYIARPDGATPSDRDRYQTVYAREPGAAAAPTAGLHFTHEILTRLSDRGCAIAPLTLWVGMGTFAPIRVDDLEDHEMHSERYDIPAETAALVRSGRPIVAVGTTVVRALETSAAAAGRVDAGTGVSRLFIRPGFEFRVVDHLVTNFHLPESTLLMLVSAFAGYDRMFAAYRHAVDAGYRFYSYGDAMWLTRQDRL